MAQAWSPHSVRSGSLGEVWLEMQGGTAGMEGRGRGESAGDTTCEAQYRGKTRQPLSKTTRTIRAATAVLPQVRGLCTCVGPTCEAHGGLRSRVPSLEAEGTAQRPLMGPLIQGGGGRQRGRRRGEERSICG